MPLSRELARLRAFGLVTYPFACVPFLFFYFRAHGLDEQGYGEVVAVYYAAMFVAEVPTGMLADRWGPKWMLVVGPLLLAAGFGAMLVAPTYAGFAVGEGLLGVGHAVLSGPPTVLLYELLARHGEAHRYLAEEGRIQARRLYGTGGAFLLGGLLAHCGAPAGDAYGLAIAATSMLCAVAAAIATTLPGLPGRPVDRAFVRHAATQLKNPPVLWLLAYWVVLFTLLRFPFHDYQPYLAAASAQEPWLGNAVVGGAIFAGMNLCAAPLSSRVPRLVERFGRVALFYAMPLVLAASLGIMGLERGFAEHGMGTRALAWLGVAMFFAQQVPYGMHMALLQEFVNHRIGSAARTTILSAISLCARLVYAGASVILFGAQQRFGMATALVATGLVGGVLAALAMWLRPRGTLRGAGPLA